MRAMQLSVVMLLAVAVLGCGQNHAAPPTAPLHPAVVEARAHFTYQGKRIPPFFVSDFMGGPGAPDFWFRESGHRISAIAVEGLFAEGDGSYAGLEITTHPADPDDPQKGEFVEFNEEPEDGVDRSVRVPWHSYRFVGTTPSGITVLEQIGNTGGSGTVVGVLFVRFEMESVGVTKAQKKDRLVMQCLGSDTWGDRVYRDVRLEGNILRLGPESSHHPGNQEYLKPAQTIVLE